MLAMFGAMSNPRFVSASFLTPLVLCIGLTFACGGAADDLDPAPPGGGATSAGGSASSSSSGAGGASGGASATGGGSSGVGGGEPYVPECTKTIDATEPAASRFDGLSSGDTLCLEDGTYAGGLDVPSGISVAALTIGGPRFEGGDTEWSAVLTMAGDDSLVYGLAFTKPDNVSSNACQVSGSNNVIKFCSCSHGGLHKHKIPLRLGGTGHLVEDSWFYGEGRYVVQCYIGDHMTFRRNIARWDSTAPNEPSEPNATFSNYNCSSNVWENNISLDYGVPETPMKYGGDFYMPNHNDVYPELNHDVHYFGNMAVNHAAETMNNRGFRADANHAEPVVGGIVRDHFLRGSEFDFVIKPNYQFEITDCTRVDVANETVACGGGADIGVRYVDGVKSSESLFPFPSEAFAKADMCASGERQSDWCSYDGPLESYVWGD